MLADYWNHDPREKTLEELEPFKKALRVLVPDGACLKRAGLQEQIQKSVYYYHWVIKGIQVELKEGSNAFIVRHHGTEITPDLLKETLAAEIQKKKLSSCGITNICETNCFTHSN